VAPGDGRAITAAVAELATDPVRRRHFGLAGRASVEHRTWAAVGDELIAHYRAVCGLSTVDELAALEELRGPVPPASPERPARTLTRRQLPSRASIG
jgi:hypothetical protein